MIRTAFHKSIQLKPMTCMVAQRTFVVKKLPKPVERGDGMPRYPDFTSGGALRAMDYVGTVAFALSGCVTAGTAGMDLLGCILVGTITSIGGGTVRDLLIGNSPVFWVEETEYVLICIVVAVLTFFFWHLFNDPNDRLLWWADTVGVGAFCVIGAQNGIRKSLAPIICAACGMFTATFGGVIRDVLCDRPVRIMHSHAEVYASTALCGASVYVVLKKYTKLVTVYRIAAGFGTAVALRYVAASQNVRLPNFMAESKLSQVEAGPQPEAVKAEAAAA